MKSEQRKFQVEFKDNDGVRSVWKYDLDITPNGPISTEQFFPKDIVIPEVEEEIPNESLPMSKRKYWSEATQKWVGYTRGRALGLIHDK